MDNIFEPLRAQDTRLTFVLVDCQSTLLAGLFESLRNDHVIEVNPHRFIGVCPDPTVASIPVGLKEVLREEDTLAVGRALFEADVVVVRTHNTLMLECCTCVLSSFRDMKERRLFILSDFLLWAEDQPKKRASAERQFDDTKSEKSMVEDEEPREVLEATFHGRLCKDEYFWSKHFEDLALVNSERTEWLQTYLVVSGLVYGRGEEFLFETFRKAVMQEPAFVKVYGKGGNLIPTVHLDDLVSYVTLLIERRPPKGIYFVKDESKVTQLQILEAISGSLGSGEVEHAALEDCLSDPELNWMTVNLTAKTTPVLIENVALEMEWKYLGGLVANIDAITREFN
jgi:hypothetical protein